MTAAPAAVADLVILLDVDNTLLDNDALIADLRAKLADVFGADVALAYWDGLEALRAELGYVDYLGALQRFRTTLDAGGSADRRLLELSAFFLDYPFASRLYPGALAVVARLSGLGPTVVLSDGDVVFQPRKIVRSGLWQAVHGRVLVDVHKEQSLDAMARAFPARRYVMVDDKPRILAAMKAAMGERLTTVFVRQGHYAHDVEVLATCPPADIAIGAIGDLLTLDLGALLAAPATELT